jgi:hypothetical protein
MMDFGSGRRVEEVPQRVGELPRSCLSGSKTAIRSLRGRPMVLVDQSSEEIPSTDV